MKKYLCVLGTLLFFLLTSCNERTYDVSLEKLVSDMVDRSNVAQYPDPFFVCRQFSSYDRETVKPGDHTWFANWDRSMFLRVEENHGRKEYVMMDTDGPGAIVRFWMTFSGDNCGEGTLRIYLDGSDKPVIEGTALDVISGEQLVGAPLSSSVSDLTYFFNRGHNLYLPIPYSKHCKVTYESDEILDFGAKTGGEAVYYNINYRTYDPEVSVKTFTLEDLQKHKELIADVQKELRYRTVPDPENPELSSFTGEILPGESISHTVRYDEAAIYKLLVKIQAENQEQALRSTIISMSFDGKKTVECPVGDFFGTGYQLHPSNTWYSFADIEGYLFTYWVMPFREECTVTIENRGTQTVNLANGEITCAPYDWDSNTMYFGAAWRQYTNVATGEQKNNEGEGGPFDVNYVTLNGKGVYVGDALTLFNCGDSWWGEGDEKIYVDGEVFPSHLGTGTEDYYGYAWCRPERISNHPFIAQPSGAGNFHPGFTVNIRYRNLDVIPFRTSLRFDMELWHWLKTKMDYAPTTFWYISPDTDVEGVSDLSEAVTPVVLKPGDIDR